MRKAAHLVCDFVGLVALVAVFCGWWVATPGSPLTRAQHQERAHARR